MKKLKYLFAIYFFAYGMLIAFKAVPFDSFTVFCLALISGLSFLKL